MGITLMLGFTSDVKHSSNPGRYSRPRIRYVSLPGKTLQQINQWLEADPAACRHIFEMGHYQSTTNAT